MQHGIYGSTLATLTMMFVTGEQRITLKRDPSLTIKEVTLKTLTQTWEGDDCGFLVEFQHLEPEAAGDYAKVRNELEEIPIRIQGILEEFKDVFAKPTSLPPKWAMDHRINMKADANISERKAL